MANAKRVLGMLVMVGLLAGCGRSGMVPTLAQVATKTPAKSAPLAPAPAAPVSLPKTTPVDAPLKSAASLQLLSTADMTEDEMAEDNALGTLAVQTVVAGVSHFERTGYLRQLLGGTLELESTTGIFTKKTEIFKLQSNPSMLAALSGRLNGKVVLVGTLDGAGTVTVDTFREAWDFSSLFNFFTKGRIVGTVQDSKQWPVPGVAITAVRQADSFVFRTVTGTDGSFALRGMVPGDYTVELAPLGEATTSETVTVAKRKVVILAGHI